MPTRKTPRESMYGTWNSMMARCYNEKHAKYPLYGARGLRVCRRWHTFQNFVDDMGMRPSGLMLERIDNDKGYSPENCKWATYAEQIRNRNITVWLTHDGKTMCIKDWADHLGISYSTLKERLRQGYSTELALTMKPEPANASKMRKYYDHCKNGHLYSEHGKVDNRSHRVCKICEKDRNRISAAARKAGFHQTTGSET